MTLLITADIHLSANPRDAYRFEFMKRLPTLVEEHDVTTVVVLGDLTEAKDGHEADFVNTVVDYFAELTRHCKVVIVSGNHDWLSSASNPFFAFLRHINKIYWVNAPTALADLLPTREKVILLPHTHHAERDWKSIPFKNYDFAFCHQTFEGAVGSFGRDLKGLSLGLFPKKLTIVSGDVHNPQQLEEGRLWYVGAPYTVDFGDEYAGRFLLLKNGALVSVGVDLPQKLLVEASPSAFLSGRGLPTLIKGDVVKVRISITSGDDVAAVVSAARLWAAKAGATVDAVVPTLDVDRYVKHKPRLDPEKGRTDEEVVKTYAKARQLDAPTTKTGLGLLDAP